MAVKAKLVPAEAPAQGMAEGTGPAPASTGSGAAER
jgi:hypothetical protein